MSNENSDSIIRRPLDESIESLADRFPVNIKGEPSGNLLRQIGIYANSAITIAGREHLDASAQNVFILHAASANELLKKLEKNEVEVASAAIKLNNIKASVKVSIQELL